MCEELCTCSICGEEKPCEDMIGNLCVDCASVLMIDEDIGFGFGEYL